MNLLTAVTSILQLILKLFGLRPSTVEIEPRGTVIQLWANPDRAKPTMLLLHGFGTSRLMTWLFQIIAFSKDYSIFVPDLLFFGGSGTDSTERSPEFQARCFVHVLRELGVEQCTVVGCSYGGIVGVRMAEAEAGLVSCLVLSNSNLALTESQSREAFKRFGIRGWPELLLPETVEGLKRLLRAVVHRRLWIPDWAYKHFLQVVFNAREKRAQVLKALVIKDNEFVVPTFSPELVSVIDKLN